MFCRGYTEVPPHCLHWQLLNKEPSWSQRAQCLRGLARPAGSFRGLGRPLAVARTGLGSPGPRGGSSGSRPAAALKPAASPGPRQRAGSPCLRDRRAPAGRSVDGQLAVLTSPSGARPRPGLGNRAAARLLPEPPERPRPRPPPH